jgi:hypothetical protein
MAPAARGSHAAVAGVVAVSRRSVLRMIAAAVAVFGLTLTVAGTASAAPAPARPVYCHLGPIATCVYADEGEEDEPVSIPGVKADDELIDRINSGQPVDDSDPLVQALKRLMEEGRAGE